MQFEQVARGIGQEQLPGFRPQPAVHDAIRNREPVEFRLRFVDRGDRERDMRRMRVEFTRRRRAARGRGGEVDLGAGTRVQPLAVVGAVAR